MAAATPSITQASLQSVQRTLLAVLMEVSVAQNQDGSGTGCWFLDQQGVDRIRRRHGNFSFAQRGGNIDAPYWSCRLVTAAGNSSQYLIHHVSTFGGKLNDEYKAGGLDASHLCPDTRCWNPHHIISESRADNLRRRRCTGDIVDNEGQTVHLCLCRGRKCVGTQNVRLHEVIDRENLRVMDSKRDLKRLVAGLALVLNINDINVWSLARPHATAQIASNYSLVYANWQPPV